MTWAHLTARSTGQICNFLIQLSNFSFLVIVSAEKNRKLHKDRLSQEQLTAAAASTKGEPSISWLLFRSAGFVLRRMGASA